MDSSQNTPRTEQEKMNQSAEEDQIVDLSGTGDQIVDLSAEEEDQVIDPPPMREQVVNPPPIVAQSRDRPIKVDEAGKQPKESRRSPWKRIWIGLVVIVAILVAFGSYSQSLANLVGSITGASTRQTTPATSTPTPKSLPATPTVSVQSTPVGPTTIIPGALILLNPGIVRQNTSMGVDGSGFDPRATVDLAVKQRKSEPGHVVTFVRTDKYGNFYDNLTVPDTLSSGTFFVEARERGSDKVAMAAGVVQGGTPQLKLGAQVGKPGDMITISVHGFSPNETIKVYWNTMSGDPVATLQADSGGSIGQAPVQVPFGAAGVNTFLFVGAKSQSMVAAAFYLLSLYPSIKLSTYAVKADNQMSFSGIGFGPGERVLVFLNSAIGQPVAIIQTSAHGTFSGAGSFRIPFALKGRQKLIFLGEESRASVAVSWTVLPYAPTAQASTYGGLPGTTITFYATGFARNEVVHVYVGHTQNNASNMVSCFLTDGKGNVAAAGSYVIPGDAQGKLVFTLVGSKSGGTAAATMTVEAAPSPVQVPTPTPFTCPLDNSTNSTHQGP